MIYKTIYDEKLNYLINRLKYLIKINKDNLLDKKINSYYRIIKILLKKRNYLINKLRGYNNV